MSCSVFSCRYVCKMVPLIKRSTDTLVELFEEKAESKKSFDVFKYVCVCVCAEI